MHNQKLHDLRNSISGQANNWEKENGESGAKGVQADKGLPI